MHLLCGARKSHYFQYSCPNKPGITALHTTLASRDSGLKLAAFLHVDGEDSSRD